MEMVSVFLACVAGACFALQAAVNGALRGTLHDGRYAAFFSICGTIITAAIFMLCVQPPLPALAVMRSAPWWNWIGGPLGALIVLAAPRRASHWCRCFHRVARGRAAILLIAARSLRADESASAEHHGRPFDGRCAGVCGSGARQIFVTLFLK